MKTSTRIPLIAVLVATLMLTNTSRVRGEVSPTDEQITWHVEGSGTHFEVTGNDNLRITLDSSETITLMLEVIGETIQMEFASDVGTSSTQVSLGGLMPNTTYYRLEDNSIDYIAFTSDMSGSYSYQQDLLQTHLVFILTHHGTKYIYDDPNGGDCTLIGVWDSTTKTCTLNTDVFETIRIQNDGITLDGEGHTIYHNYDEYMPYGIVVGRLEGITIKNLIISGVYGCCAIQFGGSNSYIKDITMNNNSWGIYLYGNNNLLTNNVVNFGGRQSYLGFYLYRSNNNILNNNILIGSSTKTGFLLLGSSNNTIADNTITVGTPLQIDGYSHYESNNNLFYHNNIIADSIYVKIRGLGNFLNLDEPMGGNYWSSFDTPDEGCYDINHNGFCDNPYVFDGGQDNLPWILQDGWQNQPPIANAGGPYSVDEGSSLLLDASGSSDLDDNIALYEWDLDNDGEYDDATGVTTDASFADDGVFTVGLKVTDDYGEFDTDTAEITVHNVSPGVDAGQDVSLDEGEPFIGGGSFTDPGADTWTATVDYGAGEGAQVLALNSDKSFDLNYPYLDNGAYMVEVCVSDDDEVGCNILPVSVVNVAPSIETLIAPLDPIQVGTPVETSATFSDPGVLDTHTATWDWGDNSTSAGTVGGDNISGSHIYETPGVYTLTLTLEDDDDGMDTATFQYVVIYDPEGGFVTGGGWIWSPLGAYVPDDTLEGKATFGFVSKYKKGAHVPTGNTEFQFKVADLNFKSTSYDWLVIAGSKAKYKGTGTINGTGEYGFMLSAIDGTPDKFRIKIWDKESGEVVYDNQHGVADDSDPVTALGGGSIVVHKAK